MEEAGDPEEEKERMQVLLQHNANNTRLGQGQLRRSVHIFLCQIQIEVQGYFIYASMRNYRRMRSG